MRLHRKVAADPLAIPIKDFLLVNPANPIKVFPVDSPVNLIKVFPSLPVR